MAELLIAEQVDLSAHDADLTPELRQIRERHARDLVEAFAQHLGATAQRKNAARAPRLGRRNPLREKIIRAMGDARRSGLTYKAFMDAWENDDQAALLLENDRGGRRLVTADDGTQLAYQDSALMRLWNLAGKT